MSARFPERGLVVAIHAGIALLLLTPLVWSAGTMFPYAVGKAVYSRTVIEGLVVLWAVLAAWRPAYRPPRSTLLVLLGAGFLVAALSGALGVSPVRSVWSDYVRMGGLVAHLHWIAFAAVAASTVRTSEDWRRLLSVNVAVGLAVALVAVLRSFGPEAPLVGGLAEQHWPRVAGTFGNPTFLGGYLQFIALLAAGILGRSLVAERPAPRPPRPPRRRPVHRARARRRRVRRAPPPQPRTWPTRVFAGGALALALWGVSVTGSMGAFAGVAAGASSAGLLWAWFAGTRRQRLVGLAAPGAVAALAVAVLLALAVRAPQAEDAALDPAANPLVQRVTSAQRIGRALDGRLSNWSAGARAFAERPWLGWGPENYGAGWARHAEGAHTQNRSRDRAHGMIVEEAAAKGAVGLAAYLGLWAFTAVAVARAARGAGRRERALVVCVGGALAGWFVQSQTLFPTAGTWLEHMLLLAYLVRLGAGEPQAASNRPPPARWPALGTPARALAVAAALALAAAAAVSNRAAYAGAAALYRAEHAGPFMDELARAIGAFEPMAAYPRTLLFENVGHNWPVLHARYPAEARRLLAWCDLEAPRAEAAEPRNWQVHHALARLYTAVAATTPGYAERAAHHVRRSLEVAPNLDPMRPNEPPQRLAGP